VRPCAEGRPDTKSWTKRNTAITAPHQCEPTLLRERRATVLARAPAPTIGWRKLLQAPDRRGRPDPYQLPNAAATRILAQPATLLRPVAWQVGDMRRVGTEVVDRLHGGPPNSPALTSHNCASRIETRHRPRLQTMTRKGRDLSRNPLGYGSPRSGRPLP